MPLERPYTTVAEVQRETKNSGSELDDWYVECVNAASRFIDEHCKRDFWFHDYSSEPYKVKRKRVLGDSAVLPFPIISVTEIRVFSDIEDSSDDNDVWDADEYHFEEGEGTIYAEGDKNRLASSSGSFGAYPFRGFFWIKGTFGYPLASTDGDTTPPPTIPHKVRRAATLIASAFSDELHKEQVGLDGTRVELLSTIVPNEAYRLLERFRDHIECQF